MLNLQRAAVQSWVVIGLVLAVVLVAQGYQTRMQGTPGEKARVFTLLGLGRRAMPRGPFQGAEVSAVLGESELDLRATTMRPGDEMLVDVLAVMGAVTIRVPDGWTVDARAVPVAGKVADKRLRPFDALDTEVPFDAGPAPRLVLRGAVVMGGLVIKS